MLGYIPFLRELEFPRLSRPFYKKTSDENSLNNCAAWAVGLADKWMQPKYEPWYFWPAGAPDDLTVESFIRAFELLGFEICADSSVELGFEKLVVYRARGGIFGHAAKQMPDGSWSSKLGDWEDIMHTTPELLESPKYGKIECFMRRRSS